MRLARGGSRNRARRVSSERTGEANVSLYVLVKYSIIQSICEAAVIGATDESACRWQRRWRITRMRVAKESRTHLVEAVEVSAVQKAIGHRPLPVELLQLLHRHRPLALHDVARHWLTNLRLEERLRDREKKSRCAGRLRLAQEADAKN